MLKSKAKIIVTTFIISVISLLFINKNYAKYLNIGNKNDDEITNWKVTITADTKDLEDTQEISFKVQDNENVVKGKIAPGMKAVAQVEIDLTGTEFPVDIVASIDDSDLDDSFKLTTKLDGESYKSGSTRTIELENNSAFTSENGKKILILELEWKNNSNNSEYDTAIGIAGETIKVPITINVAQHV